MRTVVCVLATLVVLATRQPLLAADGKAPAGWGSATVRDRSIAPGTKEKFTFVPFRTFEGGYLDTPVWVARGARPGRALCVVAGIHGDELNGSEIARRVFAATDPTQLAGTLIVLPAVNAHGFRTGNRYMPDRRDLNRGFPGNANGSVASIVAHHVFAIVREHCQALIDLHTGSDYRANLPQIRVDLANAAALALAKHFGVGVILGGAGPRHSLRRETMEAGIPAIIYEAGEPLRFQQEEVQKGVAGVQNVMAYLRLVTGTGAAPPPSPVFASTSWVRVPTGKGGVFFPSVELGARVAKDDVLGTVTDPDTEEIYEVRAKRAGMVIGMAVPRIVLSGYGLFHIGLDAE